jgi:hypothetical protein
MNCYSSTFNLRTMLLVVLLWTLVGCATIATQQNTRLHCPPHYQRLRSRLSSKTDIIERPTSDPYKGDLSIFEDPQREQKLQIQRVMDILGIKEGAQVADIGAGSGWFTVRARGALEAVAQSTPSRLIRITSSTSRARGTGKALKRSYCTGQRGRSAASRKQH